MVWAQRLRLWVECLEPFPCYRSYCINSDLMPYCSLLCMLLEGQSPASDVFILFCAIINSYIQ